MALQNVAGVLTGRGLMDCLQYYDNCLLKYLFTVASRFLKKYRFYYRKNKTKQNKKKLNAKNADSI
jgi:hypothetical protein